MLTSFFLLEPPVFLRTFEHKDVIKGSDVMMEGQVSGSAPFSVSFYKSSKLIRNDKRHKISVTGDIVALQILTVDALDTGTCQCTVENEVGKTSCDYEVTLKGWYLNLS